jgi:hypothetical protein
MAMLLAPSAAWAPDILGAFYDRRTDEVVVEIAYRGMTPDHEFVVQWDPCREGGVAGRLVDRRGDEPARTGFRVTQGIPLHDIPCRPARVTLRLGHVSHASVAIPPSASIGMR